MNFCKFLFLVLLLTNFLANAAPPLGGPPIPDGYPIDMGVGLLVAGAVGLGIRTLKKN